ncbi:MAG TPA: IPT/TIG domain-containing protein [Bryobacteraceae bacterium]|nr:IPT/TIG domain-containing protein [Bryobacteraceae bacterium]
MILKKTLSVRFFAPLLLVAGLSAAPRLNLIQTSLTVSVPAGTNGPTYSLDTFNIGSGSLALQVSSSVPWLVPTAGTSQVCGLRGGCYPISIAFQTSSLAAGSYNGIITVSDANALDAPQYIYVTAQVGGNVPTNLSFDLAPGHSTSATFTTNGPIKAAVSNATWLTTSTTTNSASGDYVTTVTATAASSMAATTYNGNITISGSSFAPDNKQISVSLNVTTQPIAQPSSTSLSFNLAQGTAAQTDNVAVTDAGQGTLTISGVTATAASSGTWLTAAPVSGGISVTADPTGLSPNTYTGTVTVASNAVNASLVIPVQLVVAAQGPPIASAGGVVNNGTFASGEPLAQGDIAAVFGDQLSFDAPQGAASLPLLTTLNNVQVLVNGKAAPVYYVSSSQINFEIPIDAATGDGTVQIVRNGTQGNLIYVDINAQVPRFIVYNGGYGIMTTPAGALTGIPSNPVKVGDTIVIYALGLGPTSPVVPSGTASPSAPNLANVPGTTQVCFGVETPFFQAPCAKPTFSGLSPNFVGLYQIDVVIPAGVQSGNSIMTLLLVDNVESTPVQLAVQ